MKFSYSWLCDHLETNQSPDQIGEILTNIGLELEALSDYSSYSQFVVATIKEFKKHPNADRLNICKVDDGDKLYQVVCGAPNVKEGMKGIFAKDGMYIPGTEITLKKGKIRGEVSEGMLLSERELKLSDDHEGIIELKKDFPNGTDAVTALELNDPVFEIGLTPNRGDCLGVRGLARDLAAKGAGILKPLDYKKLESLEFESPISWNIEKDGNSCNYVISRYFKDIINSKSPDWIQNKLISIGLRPINALVDITNFITIDIGRPLHVFDADKIDSLLNMRKANDGEKIKALDKKEYQLDSTVTVIADKNNPLAIAGIMGGSETGCTDNTKNVFLEVALFDPSQVAKTGRKLGINSDARYRFERGLDKEMIEEGLEYASYLINKICGGSVSKNTSAGKLDKNTHVIDYNFNYFEKVIGLHLSSEVQIKILKSLLFKINKITDKSCIVEVPSWRNDVIQPIDLVEEIIRIQGYENIEIKSPYATHEEKEKVTSSLNNKKFLVTKKIKKTLISNNFSEVISFSFQSEQAHNLLKGDSSLKISNAISDEHAYMRSSLLFNHLEIIEANRKKGFKNLSVFELGPVYNDSKSQENILFGLTSIQKYNNKHYPINKFDFFSLSELISKIINSLNFDMKNFNIDRSQSILFHPGQSAELRMGKKLIARYGKIHPVVLENFPKLSNTFGLEFFYENLPIETMYKKKLNKTHDSSFQFSEKDFSFIFEKNQNLFEVHRMLTGIDKKLIQNVEFFDDYNSSEIGDDFKSVTFKITIQSDEKTLTEENLENIHQNIIEKTSQKFNAKLRS